MRYLALAMSLDGTATAALGAARTSCVRGHLGPDGSLAAAVLGVNPRTFAMGIALAASCSFITPLEPSCMLVYGPGRYRFSDFFRLGGPLTALMLVVLLVLVPWTWPMEAHGPSVGAG
jgi:hypothetical protein